MNRLKRLLRLWRAVMPVLVFLLSWSFLNVLVNVRYPMRESTGWYLLPSVDVTIILLLFVVLGILGWRVSWSFRGPLVALLLFIRVLRLGDGIKDYYFAQLFHLYVDVPLAPDLVHFSRSTLPWWKFDLGVLLTLTLCLALVSFTNRALAYSANFLRQRRHILLFAAALLALVVVSLFLPRGPHPGALRTGAFADSAFPRLQQEAAFLLNIRNHNAETTRSIAAAQDLLRHTPADLAKLGRSNVYLILVESYGAAALDRPILAEKVNPVLRSMEKDLGRAGFSLASGFLESPTYGDLSWLAHATLLTGVRTADPLQFKLLAASKPRNLANFFHEAGYHTAFVQPNTDHLSPQAEFYGFDTTYDLWKFDYVGPTFAWAKMPDQYVLDFIRRRTVLPHSGPLFIAYALVSSHAPWSSIPTLVPEWDLLGNGTIFRTHPILRFPTGWPDLSNAAEAYSASVVYDLELLRSYLLQFVTDSSLVIVLGDHQPHSEVTDDSLSHAVPIHVLSHNSVFIAPYLARGYTSGMIPGQTHAPMETFLVDFLRDFSTERADASPK